MLEPARVDDGPAGGSVEGVVLSAATGLGLEGAEVTFQRDDGAASVRSGPGGAFAFAPPAPGRYRVAAVSAEGYLPFAPAWGHSQLTVDLVAGRRVRGVAIRLKQAIEYTIKVLEAGGGPAGGAQVRVLGAAAGELALLPLPEKTVTDASGQARVRAPDGAVIEARKGAGRPGRAQIDFVAQVSGEVTIRLGGEGGPAAETARLSGRAVDEGGQPVTGALVAVRDRRDNGSLDATAEALSDGDGRFAIGGLTPREHDLEIRADGFAPFSTTATAGGPEVVATLHRGGALVGRVLDARTGLPVPSFTVQVWRRPRPLRQDLVASRAFVDPAGEYELTSLGPGEAQVVIAAAGYAPSAEIGVTIGALVARADASLAAGTKVRGRVLDRETKAPIADARLDIEGRRGTAGGPALPTSSRSDDAGNFEVTGLAPGPVALFVSAAEHHARIFPVNVPASGEGQTETILLSKVKPGEDTSVELAGVGAVLSAEGEVLLVRQVIPGGGAAEAGIAAGDRIVAIEGRRIVDLGFEGAMNAIRGPEGTAVLVTVRRGRRAACGRCS